MKLVKLTPGATTTYLSRPLAVSDDGRCWNGHLTDPPWEDDGYNIRGKASSKSGRYAWDLTNTESIQLSEIMADFYLLEAVMTQVPQGNLYIPGYKASIAADLIDGGLHPSRLMPDANRLSLWAYVMQHRLVTELAPLLYRYSHFAIAGELAHHWLCMKWFTSSRDEDTMRNAWKLMHDKVGAKPVADWAVAFMRDGEATGKNGWCGNYGGDAWATGCEVLRWYTYGECHGQPFGAKEFCDRAFSLQHNGGSWFNKIAWFGDDGQFKWDRVLCAHDEGNYDLLRGYASEPVQHAYDIACGQDFKDLYWEMEYVLETDKVWESGSEGEYECCEFCG